MLKVENNVKKKIRLNHKKIKSKHLATMIETLVQSFINIFNLNHYDIKVSICPSIEENQTLGCTSLDATYLRSDIKIYIYTHTNNSIEELTETILHEITHVYLEEYLHPIVKMEDEASVNCVERLVTSLSRIVLSLLEEIEGQEVDSFDDDSEEEDLEPISNAVNVSLIPDPHIPFPSSSPKKKDRNPDSKKDL